MILRTESTRTRSGKFKLRPISPSLKRIASGWLPRNVSRKVDVGSFTESSEIKIGSSCCIEKKVITVEVGIRIDIESSTVEFTISIPPIVLNVIPLNGGEIGQPKSILG
jgi:hypothetical protein